jgi:hypothetical protein
MRKALSLLTLGLIFLAGCSELATPELALSLEGQGRGLENGIELVSASSRKVNLGHAALVGVVEGTVEVLNYSYDKDVVIYYNYEGTEWQEANCYYQETLPGGTELWGFALSLYDIPFTYEPEAVNVQFALRMDANGQSYWDNNDGADYMVSIEGSDQLFTDVALGSKAVEVSHAHFGSVYPAGNVLTVEVNLLNLAYQKDVAIVWTKDDWATVNTAPMRYTETAFNGQEIWMGAPLVDPYIRGAANQTSSESVEFCIAYTVNGVTYWDNNGGENYSLTPGGWPID